MDQRSHCFAAALAVDLARQVEKGQLPLFFGLGGRVIFRDNQDNRWGLRIPVGLAYEFEGAPFDVFVEIVPTMDFAPDTDFDLEGAIGGRFWFGGS